MSQEEWEKATLTFTAQDYQARHHQADTDQLGCQRIWDVIIDLADPERWTGLVVWVVRAEGVGDEDDADEGDACTFGTSAAATRERDDVTHSSTRPGVD